jgi:DNA-binding NtrC family response regulator
MGEAFKPIALVVEDDGPQRALISTLFEESNMKVIECESAEAALLVLDTVGGDVAMLFTDVNLAGTQTGAELADIAKARFPDLTVLVTSGHKRPELPEDTTFLPKPWRALDLLWHAEKAMTQH